jgi:hypothetical protein
LLIIVEVVYLPKDFTAKYMALVVIGCPVVQRGECIFQLSLSGKSEILENFT